jgi:hypothetical protein
MLLPGTIGAMEAASPIAAWDCVVCRERRVRRTVAAADTAPAPPLALPSHVCVTLATSSMQRLTVARARVYRTVAVRRASDRASVAARRHVSTGCAIAGVYYVADGSTAYSPLPPPSLLCPTLSPSSFFARPSQASHGISPVLSEALTCISSQIVPLLGGL